VIAALLALALGSIDPCAPIAAAAPPDAATAALYREAASLERAAGHGTTAAIAYARAAALA